ncbi:hypothetical protein KGG72_gp22 [Streptomyces phage Salutena]|uniref:Uncharacterized protein n=1 Tax=Streptomyces phage Salutena TaxID=2767576 RepID=A0A7S6TX94_9CAUD|nr:hypothetical protein KGG72_gp22 [Streptomyces phage Salutena]QOV06152.1 hypothetical protein CPT_Salutena_022 [Streptomyces phage Salutena]
MSKHRRVSEKGLSLITRTLPTKYKSKAGLVAALAGVALSAAALFATDYPQVAVAIQALTAFGFVENDSE